jgi:antibiotic biosynthesis monooxygenase (ABM) superfamily enzyme
VTLGEKRRKYVKLTISGVTRFGKRMEQFDVMSSLKEWKTVTRLKYTFHSGKELGERRTEKSTRAKGVTSWSSRWRADPTPFCAWIRGK